MRLLFFLAAAFVCVHANTLYPNFLLLVSDDLGYADVGMFGSPTIRTPNIDRLIHEGMKFTQFYAAPLCTPSRGAMLTGKIPIKTGLYTHLPYPHDNKFRVFMPTSLGCLPKNETILPEYLKQSGANYFSSMVGKHHLGRTREQDVSPHIEDSTSFMDFLTATKKGGPQNRRD